MNIPSHYQSAFFAALDARDDVDLKVVYLHGASAERATEGWRDGHEYQPYEASADGEASPERLEVLLPDWRERIHILGSHFFPELVQWFCAQGTAWCHWSEVPGIRLAEALGYRMPLFRLLNLPMLWCKRGEGRRVRDHALGVFGQGQLACKAFRAMGVPAERCADLYYVPAALAPLEPCAAIRHFAHGRKVFLSAGALCRRKGIDVLLKAFARLDTPDWCVVLCGLDRANGAYQALARKLGIEDRVLFFGAHPSDRMAEVYAAADLFVLPSRFDGWGAVLNEAASLGLPVVGTDWCGASWHLVEPGKTGFRVRAGSVGSLAKAMRHYVADPALAARHGAAAKQCFNERFTPEQNAERLVDALRKWSRR